VYKLSVYVKKFGKLQDQKIFYVVNFNEIQRKSSVFYTMHLRYE